MTPCWWRSGAPFALPNVWVIEVDDHGLILSLRDYVNPVAVEEALARRSLRGLRQPHRVTLVWPWGLQVESAPIGGVTGVSNP